MPTPTLDDLTLADVQDESNTLEALARRHGTSEPYMAGVIDAVTGTDEWIDALDWCEESEWVRRDYRAGFRHGQWLLDGACARSEAEAIAGAEFCTDPAAELAAVLCDDCPF